MSVTLTDTHEVVLETLDERLRDAVRREGVDPQRDAGVVRRLAERVLADHDQRSLTGAVLPVADPHAVLEELVARVAGFGVLQRYFDDPTVEEVWINDPSRVFVARAGRHELTSTILTQAEVRELVERMLKSSGRRVDLSQPFVDAMLPDGHRLHVVLEGISRGFSAVNIRKFVVRASRLGDLVSLGSVSEQAAGFLEAAVVAGLNVVVAGGTQTGKTTMLNCLAAAIPGGDRVVSVEEVFELPKNAILRTCEPSFTPASHSTGQARARRSTGSATTVGSSVPRAGGRLCGSSVTTTSRRRPRSHDRSIRPCWLRQNGSRQTFSLPGTSTALPGSSRTWSI